MDEKLIEEIANVSSAFEFATGPVGFSNGANWMFKKLQEERKIAQAALAFYADEKNRITTRKDDLHEAKMTIVQDARSYGFTREPGLASTLLLIGALLLIGGRCAEEALEAINNIEVEK